MSDLTNNESQLSVFNYSQLENSEIIIEDIQVIKQNIEDISTKILDTGRRLTRLKDNLPHGQFLPTLEREFTMSERTARDFMATYRAFGNRQHVAVLEGMPRRAIQVITSAMNNKDFDEDTKEQFLTEVKEKTEEKGKALTEKEIKEITSPYLEQIEQLKREKKMLEGSKEGLQQIIGLKEEQLKEKDEKIKSIEETLAKLREMTTNQANTIKEKETALEEVEKVKESLEKRQSELEKKEQKINETIDKETKAKLEKEKEIALAELNKDKAKVAEKEKELQRELKEAQKLKLIIEEQKAKFNDAKTWLNTVQNFNDKLNENATKILIDFQRVERVPNFDKLNDDLKQAFIQQFEKDFMEFEKNNRKWQETVNHVYQTLEQVAQILTPQLSNVINIDAIDVEVA